MFSFAYQRAMSAMDLPTVWTEPTKKTAVRFSKRDILEMFPDKRENHLEIFTDKSLDMSSICVDAD